MNIIWAAIALVVSIECFVEQDPVLQCKHGLVTDARFSSIKRHLSLSTHCETTPDMLADPTFPNEEQQKAIAQWMSAHSECHSRAQPRPSESTSSALAGRLDEIESAMIFDAVDLYPHLQNLTQMRPVVVNPQISLAQLFEELAALDN